MIQTVENIVQEPGKMRGTLLLLMFLLTCGAEAQQTVREREDIASRGIRKQVELRVAWNDGSWSSDTIHYRFHTYDAHGNHIVNGFYGEDGAEYQLYLRAYDSLNLPYIRKYFCDKSNSNPSGKVCLYFQDYEFDNWGNVIQEVGYGEDSLFSVKVLFRRDSLGNPIERWEVFKDVTRNKYYRYTYNEHGDQSSLETFDDLNQTISFVESVYRYDSQGRKTMLLKTNRSNERLAREEYSYDESGNLTMIIQHDAQDNPLRKRLFIYRNARALTELRYTSEEVFPIRIDDRGFPNVEIIYAGHPAWVIWDTGDMIGLVLSKEIIERAAPEAIDSIRLRDSEGITTGFRRVYIGDSVTILGQVHADIPITESNEDYNGLIGPRFVFLKRFTIDYKNQFIGISNHSHPGVKYTGEILPMVPSTRLPRLIIVKGIINGREVLIELDTGKSRTVIDPEIVEALGLEEGANGVVIPNLALGQTRFSIDNAKKKGFSGISHLLPSPIRIGIGSDLLSKFTFTVDYDLGIVVLAPVK